MARMTLRSWGQVGAIVIGILVVVGVATEGADWAFGLYLRAKRDKAYGVLSRVQHGMSRGDVRGMLEREAQSFDRLRDQENGDITVYVHYSLFEGCYVFVEFENGRVVRISASQASDPGPCDGAPKSWSR